MRLSTITLMIAGFLALVLLSNNTQAYHEYSWYSYGTQSMYGAGGYPAYTTSVRYAPAINTNNVRSGYTDSRYRGGYFPPSSGASKYDSRYRGGFFPAFYQQSRPYGYQTTFKSGSSSDKTFHSRSMSWYYGTGKSDYFYDNGRRYSKYYQYN